MRYAVTAEEMQRCDARTMEYFGMPSMVLMERAALAVFHRLCQGDFNLERVLVVCGTGNNGGDGLAVARLLHLAGIRAEACVLGNMQRMSPQAREQLEILKKYGAVIKDPEELLAEDGYTGYTTAVDAMFGVGLSRDMGGVFARMARRLGEMENCRVLAVDIPSGIDATTGAVLGTAVRADATVTFAWEKWGTVLFPGASYAGEVTVADVGITGGGFDGSDPACRLLEEADLGRLLPARKRRSNKGSYGKLLIAAGSRGMAGAAALAARAAYASGCGLVRIFTPECNRAILQQLVPEATVSAWEGREAGAQLAQCLAWADAAVVGPGMGVSKESEAFLRQAAVESSIPVLIDADGLTLLAGHEEWAASLEGRCVLTPHPGEMGRLMGMPVEEILRDVAGTARAGAKRWRSVCLLKDARTVIAPPSPEETLYVNTSGCDGMAVGGSGDTLSGIIGTLLAQHMPALEAAAAGAFLHGRAGEWCQEKKGPRSMTAADLADGIAQVLKRLDEGKAGI